MDAKITLYTTSTCPFSKAEREYLKSKNLPFEEKTVEGNEANLKEMLQVSDNFAGVPVTMITQANGNKLLIKGFTKEDFEEELTKAGMITKTTEEPAKVVEAAPAAMPTAPEPVKAPEPMTPPQPVAPAMPTPPSPMPVPEAPTMPTPPVESAMPQQPEAPLSPVMPVAETPTQAPAAAPVAAPQIPDLT